MESKSAFCGWNPISFHPIESDQLSADGIQVDSSKWKPITFVRTEANWVLSGQSIRCFRYALSQTKNSYSNSHASRERGVDNQGRSCRRALFQSARRAQGGSAVGSLPGELGQFATKVAVGGRLLIDGATQIQRVDDGAGAQIEHLGYGALDV